MADETLRRLEGLDTTSADAAMAPDMHRLLSGGTNTDTSSPPPSNDNSGHTGSPTLATTFDNALGASITRPRAETRPLSHMRSMSLADSARNKRLSLHFPKPLQPASASRSPRPPSWAETPLSATAHSSETAEAGEVSTESNMLAVLATQERRVLELKEELVKAERELTRLKQQWSQHEMLRKKQDVRRVAQLQPLSTAPSPTLSSIQDSEDSDGSNMWMQKEMERRKQILTSVKSSNRRVFSGSKHVRTLSLLSPDKTYTPSFPQPSNLDEGSNESSARASVESKRMPIALTEVPEPVAEARRASTEVEESGAISTASVLDLTKLQSEALNTGRRMAADLKDGLWTFLEDIRQATVGDEPIHGHVPQQQQHRRTQSVHPGGLTARQSGASLRSQRSKNNLQRSQASQAAAAQAMIQRQDSAKKPSMHRRTTTDVIATSQFDIGGGFWRDHGLDEPRKVPTKVVRHERKTSKDKTPQRVILGRGDLEDEVAWDMWDTPGSRYTSGSRGRNSSFTDSASDRAGSVRSTPRTSTSSADPNAVVSNTASDSTLDTNKSTREPARDPIPWPSLAKLVTPSQLKRTASNLMHEWERSLTSSPVQSRVATPAVERKDPLAGGSGGKLD